MTESTVTDPNDPNDPEPMGFWEATTVLQLDLNSDWDSLLVDLEARASGRNPPLTKAEIRCAKSS